MATKSIYSKAPTRIDLAGGTIDLWPLYLFLRNPVTLNLGIDLFAEAKIDWSSAAKSQAGEIFLRSEDQNIEVRFPWKELLSPHPNHTTHPSLELHYKLLKYFVEKKIKAGSQDFSNVDFALTTRARSPSGAGLGGSSTLSVAMVGALATWAADLNQERTLDRDQDGEALIEIVRDIETTVIRVPAGLQDYYGAMYGGLQSLQWGIGKHTRSWLPEELISELEDRILLFYSGQSRNSGINNWALFKGFIDQQDEIRAKFEKIALATSHLEAALRARNWDEVGNAIREEWEIRKTLAPGITTPEINRAFDQARKLGPIAGKVCGAGGGGCFFVYLPMDSVIERTEIKSKIQQIFTDQGIKPLFFRGAKHGLEVQVSRA